MTWTCADPATWEMRYGAEEPTGIAWYKNDGTLRDFTTGVWTWTINVSTSNDSPHLLTFGNSIVVVQLPAPNLTLHWPQGAFNSLSVNTPYVVQVNVLDGTNSADRSMKDFLLLLTPAQT